MSRWSDSNFQTYKEEQGEESCPHGGGQPAPAQVTVTCAKALCSYTSPGSLYIGTPVWDATCDPIHTYSE